MDGVQFREARAGAPAGGGARPRAGRREVLLAASTRLFNRHSFAAVTLEAVAAEVGVTPGALYHHFGSKEALVFECLSRGLQLYSREIERAAEPGVDGLECVRRFVRGRLKPGEPRMITFTDIDALPKAHREAVHAGRARNVERLQALVARGHADGSIAPRDPFLTSLGVFSVLDWMPFWYSEKSYYTRQDAADAIDDILTHGVLRRDVPEAPPPPPPAFAPLLQMLAPPNRRAAKKDRLLQVATESFNLRGVVGSSLEQIASDAGVSRSAYYYHASDKTELLYLCLERACRIETEALDFLLRSTEGIADPVRRAAAAEAYLLHLIIMLQGSAYGPKIGFHNVPYLSPGRRDAFDAMNRALSARNEQRYVDAIRAGVLRPLDSHFVQEIGAGLRNQIPAWSRLTAAYEGAGIAESHAALFLYGLKTRPRPART